MKLRQIAHSRTGDKGDTSNISLIAYHVGKTTNWLLQRSDRRSASNTISSVLCAARSARYELPKIGALNFVSARGALGGGVTRSLGPRRPRKKP